MQAPVCEVQQNTVEQSTTPVLGSPNDKTSSIQVTGMSSYTSALHVYRKRKEKAPIVESQVRRSCRIQQLNNGFRRKTCVDKNCLPCNADPPLVSGKVERNLSITFCKVPGKDCEEALLHQPKKKKGDKKKESKEEAKKVGKKKGSSSSPA